MTSTDIYTPFLPDQYCVYHTTYSGTLLPPNYIGSSSVYKVLNKNYRGSVLSKKYKAIWLSEIKLHPELFLTVIVSFHDTRSNATWKELQLQRIFNVVKNPLFVNQAYASINGYFGIDTWTIRSDKEKKEIAQKISNNYKNKTTEEMASSIQKQLDTKFNKTSEEKLATRKKISNSHKNKTTEEKAITKQKQLYTKFNKTPEEKAITKQKRCDAMNNKTEEEKLIHAQKSSIRNGKNYLVTSPTGEQFQIHSLSAFCKKNKLTNNEMSKVSRGKRKSHKGWLCVRLPD